jgi:hypothetical protein
MGNALPTPDVTPPERGTNSVEFRPALFALGLALATLITFWPATKCAFINFDDPDYVTSNPHVQDGLTWNSVRWAFIQSNSGNWHPLTWLSHMIDVEWFGHGPAGPHFTNILLHAANGALLLLALNRLTGALWPSLFVAAFFALHPLRVESVAWVAERKDVLSAFFGLGALWAYAIGAPRENAGWMRLLPALILYAMSLLSKPMLVTFPFVLLMLDYWPLKRFTPTAGSARASVKILTEKMPFLVLTIASCIITFLVQQRSGAMQSLYHMPLDARLENGLVSYSRYLGKIFWPTALATPYPHPGGWPLTGVAAALLLVCAVSALAVYCGHKYPFLPVGWLWYLGMLVPVLGLVQVGAQSMADRYTYLPSVGIFLVVAWTMYSFAKRRHLPASFWAFPAILVLAAAVLTRHQLGYWKNTETLFTHSIRVTRENWLAHYYLGWHLDTQARPEEALRHYDEAIRIKPNCAEAWNNIGFVHAQRGDFTKALNLRDSPTVTARPGRCAQQSGQSLS